MSKQNGHNSQKVESESILPMAEVVDDPRKLPTNIRLQMFNQELADLLRKYGVALKISTQEVNPAYVVSQIQAVDVWGM